MTKLGKLSFAALAALPVLRAGIRVWWFERTTSLPETADRLRKVREFRLRPLRNPALLAGCADRLLPMVPPPGYGACLKRSLILLDLWARCGLRPELHLGYLRSGEDRSFHAWVSAPGELTKIEEDHAELWRG